ncbi:MAG: pilus assembly protein, partial [Clostridiaceae bacterium]|nr:pilus assembly protein [Clostridiaceae bacterium]
MKSRRVLSGWNACTNSNRKAQRGSATVEAAIVLPIVMLAFMAVLSIIRIAVTYQRMQQALNQVSCQLSQYSYLYAISGLKEQHDKLNKEINEAVDELKKQQDVFTAFYGEMQSITENMGQINVSDINDMESIINLAGNLKDTADSY